MTGRVSSHQSSVISFSSALPPLKIQDQGASVGSSIESLPIASFQHGGREPQAHMDVSGGIPAAWMPAIHAGMTKISIFMFCGRS